MSPELLTLLGGASLLVYSIEEISRHVQYLAGPRFRNWTNTFAHNRFTGLLLGIVLSILLSSSAAVTIILVGLASARLLTLEQVFSVTLGASIGTTFIVHIFAFGFSSYGLGMFVLGFALSVLARSDKYFHGGRALMFLGLMFFSMKMVVEAGTAMEQNELFQYVVNYFRDRPLVSLLISASLAALVHSSAATIAFVMSMMIARNGSMLEAMPWVLGANLGTATTAYFASFRSGVLGRQAALGNLLCKVVGVALCYPLMKYAAVWIVYFVGPGIGPQIAFSHTAFNLLVAVIFFPFIGYGVRFVRKAVPEQTSDGPFTFRYLDPRSLNTPELALAQAQREILRLSDIVEQMVERCVVLFQHSNDRDVEAIREKDQVADFINKGVKLFLTKLSQNEMTPEQVRREFELLLRTNDLENIGDIVDKNILELVRKNRKKGYVFSKEGEQELLEFHSKVVELVRLSTTYFNSRDRSLFARLQLHYREVEELTFDLSERHVQRLHRAVKESLESTSVHLDLLGNLKRVADLSVNFTKLTSPKTESDKIV